MHRFTTLAVMACACFASPSDAALYVMSGSGQIDSITALRSGQSAIPPSGSINIGDDFSFSFRFETSNTLPREPFVDDPAVNIYYITVTDFVAQIGTYSYVYDNSYFGNSSLQLWNNRSGTDAQSFSFFGRGPNQLPFDTGVGQTLESLSVSAFDYTASARNSDSISEIAAVSSFAQRSFSWLQYNTGAEFSVHVGGKYNATIAAVPEPATWAMMLVGFGAMGYSLRRKRTQVHATYA